MERTILELEEERRLWSIKTFPKSTALSSLQKLKTEVEEIEKDIISGIWRPEEYADVLMCLFESGSRQVPPIYPEDIFKAFETKLSINKQRDWIANEDNTYSHLK